MNHSITYLRNMAIVAIVLHHSLIAFCGWPPNHAIGGDIPVFADILSGLLKNFGLGVFTFISGFVLYYQAKKQESCQHFLIKKIKRIIIPCLIWACVYGLFFSSYMYSTWPAAINGTHLWYLPMLFLCVIVGAAHFFVRKPLLVVTVCYIVIGALGKFTHFRTFMEFSFYFPVFYAGFWTNKFRIDKLIAKYKMLSVILALGGAALWTSKWVEFWRFTDTLNMLIASSAAYLLICVIFPNTGIHKLWDSLAKESFSIYLIHQFVINLLLGCFDLAALSYIQALMVLFSCALIIPWVLSFYYSYIKRKYCNL